MAITLVILVLICFISMVFNIGYILHELGWFPHGKYRGPMVRLIKLPDIPRDERNYEYTFGRGLSVQSHYLKEAILKRASSSLYDESASIELLHQALESWRKDPNTSRRDDLINTINRLTLQSDIDKGVLRLIDDVTEEVLKNEPE